MQADIELLCTSKPQHLGCSTSMITPPLTCDPGRADRVNLPHVLSSHEEATVRCAKARPGSNSSSGSQAPVRSKTSGPHASAQHMPMLPVFISRCGAGRHVELIPSIARFFANCPPALSLIAITISAPESPEILRTIHRFGCMSHSAPPLAQAAFSSLRLRTRSCALFTLAY